VLQKGTLKIGGSDFPNLITVCGKDHILIASGVFQVSAMENVRKYFGAPRPMEFQKLCQKEFVRPAFQNFLAFNQSATFCRLNCLSPLIFCFPESSGYLHLMFQNFLQVRSFRPSILAILGFSMVSIALAGMSPAEPRYDAEGFRIPDAGVALAFPAAHGNHPEFAIEWWYLTGHAFGEGERRFGFQATFFRRAGSPPARSSETAPEGSTAFGAEHLYLAHVALLDAETGQFLYQERLNRNGWAAFSETGRLNLRNGNWTLEMVDEETETMRLRTTIRNEAGMDFTLVPQKPLVRFGEDGLSRKGADPDAVSYYLTFTRLQLEGTVRVAGQNFAVQGLAWMDHEIASRQLSPELEGWDWVAMQLFDGTEIKAYILRRHDGSPEPYSRLMTIDQNNQVVSLNPEQFSWDKSFVWESPQTGGRYPIAPGIRFRDPQTGLDRSLRLRPLAQDQEIGGETGGIAYWEGACDVLDENGQRIGYAFLELVGYAGSVEGRL
jgi:predicted secreted hydrolase